MNSASSSNANRNGLHALILDGDQRSALAAVRSLGRAGLRVGVGETHHRSLAGASRYCATTVEYATPNKDPQAFVASLQRIVEEHGVDFLLPMTDVTTGILVDQRERFPNTHLPLPPSAAFRQLTDKASLASFAAQLGVPVPATITVNKLEDVEVAIAQLQPPFVIKPMQSKIWFEGQWRPTAVQYAPSVSRLRQIVSSTPWLGQVSILIQQYIGGQGQGVFALFDHGRPVAWFAHRRIREKPPTGGISVVSESMAPDPQMQAHSERLLSAAGWHGVAMVEFKVTPDGRPYLIEVNGRFWGSLQLAVDSGVDFPRLLYQLTVGEPVERPSLRIGRRCRWLLGDLDHLYLVLKAPGQRYSALEKARAIGRFLNFFSLRTRYEINRFDDMRPFLRELATYFGR